MKQNVEVMDYTTINTPIPKLKEANALIQQAYQLMADLKDKIILFPWLK